MPMEPVVAVAHVSGNSCEVWAPTQNPQAAQTEVARVLGMPPDNVRVHVTFLGGGFGRKSKADFCSEAALLSKRLGAPVRVQFTREDDVRHDYVNAVSTNRLTAGLDAQRPSGRVAAPHGLSVHFERVRRAGKARQRRSAAGRAGSGTRGAQRLRGNLRRDRAYAHRLAAIGLQHLSGVLDWLVRRRDRGGEEGRSPRRLARAHWSAAQDVAV